ncbi:hypothetical protein [Endozoicomonas sp. Mp262]|uniref:hypothetical protein n=1 Tax=Endozoicomonas sp. Mp262 TaxID=2919499 RepID=UPI0021D8D07C
MAYWDTARELAQDAGKAAGIPTKGAKGFIFDKKSGLTAYVLQNASTVPPEIRVVFGGTTSGEHTGGLGKRSLLNGAFSLRQWIANAKNALLGQTPDSYRQAAEITQHVQNMIKTDPRYTGFELKVSGHSKGGGEAEYAALCLEDPVEAICFSSAELGKAMRGDISEERKATAARYVTHYKIKGDPVPNLGNIAGELGHLGKVVTLPAEHAWNSPIDRHDKFTRHIRHFLNT